MVNYQNGKIYKLINLVDDKIYIGSTCCKLRYRKSTHKSCAKHEKYKKCLIYNHLNNIGWDYVKIVLIELWPCQNKMELHKRERHWIELLKPCLNKIIPTRTPKEYYKDNKDKILKKCKEYRENNKEKIKKRDKQYKEAHKEYYKNYNKQYRESNKEKIKNMKRDWHLKHNESYNCLCGGKYIRCHKSAHFKTKKHNEWEQKKNSK